MSQQGEVIFETESLCPICLEKIAAFRVKEGTKVYLVKECTEHGKFKTLIWNGASDIEDWIREKIPTHPKKSFTEIDQGCPFDCGLCDEHRQHTCTALIEVTERCNLGCEFCFASSTTNASDPSLDKIKFWYERVLEAGGPYNIQISGGEPTLRDDLDQIIELGHDLGFEFIQLNTNGLRLAEDKEYVKRLKEAGLNSVFLQFDGVNDQIYKKLRGAEIFEQKLKAIDNLAKYNIGIILVPTLVPGVNLDNIGEIINFAIGQIPVVRGVHFQPVSYFGRFPNEANENPRITIPDVMSNIEEQTNGQIKVDSFRAPNCENSLCSFHGNYLLKANQLDPIVKDSCCSSKPIEAEVGSQKARDFVSQNWKLPEKKCDCNSNDSKQFNDFDKILSKLQTTSFSISGMAFQDVWNIDLERLKDCCIHVVSKEGNLIPFCIYNLTDSSGNSLYRG